MEQWIEMLWKGASQAGRVLLTIEEVIFFAGVLAGVLATLLLVWVVCTVIANVHIFQKAGEGGWKSFVPIYRHYVTYKICWKPLWFWVSALLLAASVALGCVPHNAVLDVLAIVVTVAAFLVRLAKLYHLSRAFGHGVPFTLGLLFLQPIFILVLGLGGSRYQGNPCRKGDQPAEAASPAP